MKSVFCGANTPHAKGEFCRRVVTGSYFISYFDTPFLYEREGTMAAGNAGDFLIVPPGMPVYHGNPEEGYVNSWIYLKCEELAPVLEKYPLPICTAFSLENDLSFRHFLEKVHRENITQNVGYRDRIFYLAAQLVIDLYRAYRRGERYNTAGRLEDAREEILQSPEKTWCLEEMAALCGYSVSRFSVLYKEQFGCSPKQDILNARIELACRMLRYTGVSITEIAAACGFQSIYYFPKYFKKVTGLSPKNYAENKKTP